jgi:hypothetical protein
MHRNLRRALAVAGGSYSAETVRFARAIGDLWRRDRDMADWIELLEAYERDHAYAAPRNGSGTYPSGPREPHEATQVVTVSESAPPTRRRS